MWLIVTSLFLAGCPGAGSNAPPPTNALPYQGVHLKFVVPASLQLAPLWAPAINDWQDENGASVELLEADLHEPADKWIAELSHAPTSLVLLPTPQLGELAGAGLVATIPDGADAPVRQWPQPPPSLRSAVATLGNAEAFVVATSPTPVVAIRGDLLKAAGRTAPMNWEEYDRLIAELQRWASGHIAVEPRDEASVATVFLARALSAARHPAQLSVELDVSSGEPLIASPPYVRALEEMQALTPHLTDNVQNMSPADCLQALADGTAAVGIVWAPAGDVELPAKSAAEANLTFHPLPGRRRVYDREAEEWTEPNGGQPNRPALCGFAGYSVAVTNVGTAAEQAAAWDLWGLLARYQAEETIVPLRGSATMERASRGDELISGLSPTELQSCRDALAANLRNRLLACELPMLGRTQLRASLTSAIRQALEQSLDPTTALQQAEQEWTRNIEQIGRTRVLNSYRLRLGLVPVPE
jgi:ABC-type glycerol-3-phosphate transport system substrate-binding protein